MTGRVLDLIARALRNEDRVPGPDDLMNVPVQKWLNDLRSFVPDTALIHLPSEPLIKTTPSPI